MALIELHRVFICFNPISQIPLSIRGKVLINPDHISLIQAYETKRSFPEDLSGINPDNIGDTMTEIALTTTDPLGKGSERIVVIESYDYVKEAINSIASQRLITLHDISHTRGPELRVDTFSLHPDHIIAITEDTTAEFPKHLIIEEDKAKLEASSLGKGFRFITTDLLGENGRTKVFRAVESREYIHSKM